MITYRLRLAVVALVALAGCSSSRSAAGSGTALDRAATERQSSPVYEILHPALDVAPNGDGSYSFIFSAGASGTSDSPQMRLMRGIVSVGFLVQDAAGNVVDSLTTTDIPVSGVQGADGNASLTATARVEWRPRGVPATPLSVVMRANGADGVIVRVADIPLKATADRPTEPLVLTLTSEQRGSMMEFTLEVERIAAGAPDEYLPSGERFRIEIVGDHGERVWSSSNGQMFIQAIGPVVPERVGERVTYHATFDGRNDETHAPLAPGRYSVIATIPAKPRPYVLREELSWSGQ